MDEVRTRSERRSHWAFRFMLRHPRGVLVAFVAIAAVVMSTLVGSPGLPGAGDPSSTSDASGETAAPVAPPAPRGTVADPASWIHEVPEVREPIPAAPVATESWTPASHSVTKDGATTLTLYARPAFRRDAGGWTKIDSKITTGTGPVAFEALGMPNPVHFGTTADALVTIDTLDGPVTFGLNGASVAAPTLVDDVIRYEDVFPGVDLEFTTRGGRVGKHLVLSDGAAPHEFQFAISDPGHVLGEPSEGEHEAWEFSRSVGFGTALALPAPAAWSEGKGVGAPGTAHQRVTVTDTGYTVDLSVDSGWIADASFPVVLDPAVEWKDLLRDWDGLDIAFAPTGTDTCDGGPCTLADPVEDYVAIGDPFFDDPDLGYYLTYVGADLSYLAGRNVTGASLGGDTYYLQPVVQDVCAELGPGSTGAELAAARCGDPKPYVATYPVSFRPGKAKPGQSVQADESDWWYPWWSADVTDSVQGAVAGGAFSGYVRFAIGMDHWSDWDQDGHETRTPGGSVMTVPALAIVYEGYPAPRPLRLEQTFGCDCWAGGSTRNQASAADPVNTATGALIESYTDLSIAGLGVPIAFGRTYNSLDTQVGPFGPGWQYSFGASLIENASGELVFRDGSGTQTRFGEVSGGGYAPLDAAVSATLSDGPDGTRVMRNLTGQTMTFDAAGVLVASADERGQGLGFAYDDGLLTIVTDALGQTLTLEWDGAAGSDARIISATTSDGRTVSYDYATTAGAKRLVEFTDVGGQAAAFTYDAVTGGISQITDPLGNISARNTYDSEAGRIASQADETGAVTTFAWDTAAQTATVTDPTGRTRQDVYLERNLVAQIDGNGSVSHSLYDGDDNPGAYVDAEGRMFRDDHDERDRLVARAAPAPDDPESWVVLESWTYDDSDRVVSHTDAEGWVTTYTYDDYGLVTSRTDPDGGVWTYTYTTPEDGVPAHLLKTQTDPLERTTTYSYNTAGDRTSVTTPGGHTTSYTYDAAHRLTSSTTPTGGVTSYTYDATGRVLTTTDPVGGVTTSVYDAAGQLVRVTDPSGTWVDYDYDAAGRLIETTDSAGRDTATTYDDAGRVSTTTDALGAVTTYGYDDAGWLTTVTDALDRTTTSTYDSTGRLTSVTDPTGAVTTYEYDILGQVVAVTDPDGVQRQMQYDPRGNLVGETSGDPDAWTSHGYDPMGRLSYTQDPDGVFAYYTFDVAGQLTDVWTAPTIADNPEYWIDGTTFTYDLDGNQTAVIDPRGYLPEADPADFTTTVTYDADGRPLTVADPLANTTTTTFDAVGRPVSVTDPAGYTTTTDYDALGRITAVQNPADDPTEYTYDLAGNLTEVTDARGRVTTYTYDSAGNPLTKTDPLGRTTAMGYDAVGRLTTTVKPSGTATTNDPDDATITYSYDDADHLTGVGFSDQTPDLTYTYTMAGRPETITRADDGISEAAVAYAYDTAGRPVTVSRTGPTASAANYAYTPAGRLAGAAWSTGQLVAYSYDAHGRLSTVEPTGLGTIPTAAFGYDPLGNRTTITADGTPGRTTTSTYDAAGRLANITHAAGSSVLADYELVRDARGNPTQLTSTIAGPTGPTTSTTAYDYDENGWLTTECTPTSGTDCAGATTRTEYTYDPVGLRTELSVTDLVEGAPVTTSTTYTYDDADQLIAQAVDETATVTNTWTLDGALDTTTTGAGTRDFDTDLSGEVTTVALEDQRTVAYSYDPAGNRTARTVDGATDATWVWDDSTGLPTRIGEYGPTGAMALAWLPDPGSTSGAALAATQGSGDSSWLLVDPFANVTGELPTDGAAVDVWELDAFGVQGSANGPSGRLGFAGQYLDELTGLYDMRARDYDPTTGQFTSTDPVTAPVGMAYVSGFAYGFNNPLVLIDPAGTFPRPWDDLPQAMKILLSGPIMVAELITGVGALGTIERTHDAQTSMANGGSGWDAAQIVANPMYGPVASTYNGVDAFRDGRPGDGLLNAESAVVGTVATAMMIHAVIPTRSGGIPGLPSGTKCPTVAAETGGLTLEGSTFSASEKAVAERLAGQGRNVVLREATGIGRTSDLLVDGIPYDVYTPEAGTSVRNILSNTASKWSQVDGGGVVIDLSNTGLAEADFGNALSRVNGFVNSYGGTPLSDVQFFGGG